MNAQDKQKFQVKTVCQVGVVVKDLDQVVKDWTENFGFGPWSFLEMPHMRYAAVFVGPIEFELVQPVEGELQGDAGKSLTDFLNKWGDGVHHIAFMVDDVTAEVSKLIANGVKLLAQGGSEWAYFLSGGPGSTIFELMRRASYDLIKEKGLHGFLEAKLKERQAK